MKSKPLLGDALEFHLQANLLADGKGYIQPFLYQADRRRARDGRQAAAVSVPRGRLISLLGGRSWAWHQLVGVLAAPARRRSSGSSGAAWPARGPG